jgi:hypothetical protein
MKNEVCKSQPSKIIQTYNIINIILTKEEEKEESFGTEVQS